MEENLNKNVVLFWKDNTLHIGLCEGEKLIHTFEKRPSADQWQDGLAEEIAAGLQVEGVGRVIAPGGLLKPISPGFYQVNEAMLKDASCNTYGEHPYNRLVLLTNAIARILGAQPIICDPLSSDLLNPLFRLTGLQNIRKLSRYHACEQRAIGEETANLLGSRYEDLNLIIARIGKHTSVGAHCNGNCVDVNDVFGGEGPMGFSSSGDVPSQSLVGFIKQRSLSEHELERLVLFDSGVFGYLGTVKPDEIDDMLDKGDSTAILTMEALVYQVSKAIGAAAVSLGGRADAIALGGQGVRSKWLNSLITERVEFIAPVKIIKSLNMLQFLGRRVWAAGTSLYPIRQY